MSDLEKQNLPGAAQDSPMEGAETTNFPPRRAGFKNVILAFQHINDASITETVRQRISDYVTIGLVVLCILSIVAAIALKVPPGLRFLPLIFTIGAVLIYMLNRIGIVISLSKRQALIVWQIVIASFWLGVTSAMMVMMSCFFFSGGQTGMGN